MSGYSDSQTSLTLMDMLRQHPKNADASAHAKENRKQTTGLEPLDPTKPYRVGKKGNAAIEISAASDSPKPLESELELAQTD